jgi:hypothetical protein
MNELKSGLIILGSNELSLSSTFQSFCAEPHLHIQVGRIMRPSLMGVAGCVRRTCHDLTTRARRLPQVVTYDGK